MKYFPVFICLILSITFYSFSFFGFSPGLQEDILRDKLIKKVGTKLEKENGLLFRGIGGGSKSGKIREISIIFGRYGKPLNIEEGRKLILKCIKNYLDEINSNKEIRPYLITYPYTEKNIDITILSFYRDGNIAIDPDICDVSACRGFIFYRTCTSLDAPYNSTYKETYEEALIKVKQPTIQQDINKNVDSKDESGVAKRLEYETPVSFSDRTSTTSP